MRRNLRQFVISAGTAALAMVLERERTEIVGPRYAHLATRHAGRSGSAPGELVMGGRRVQVRRPRARTVDGHEFELPSWAAFAAEDPLRGAWSSRCSSWRARKSNRGSRWPRS